MRAWSFHLQIFFLGHRAEQHLEMARMSAPPSLTDPSMKMPLFFPVALHAMGNINERDYQTYRQVFDMVVKKFCPPLTLLTLSSKLL